MADDVPVSSGKNNEKEQGNTSDDETYSSKKITVHVKTHKEKETFQISENVSVKDVCTTTAYNLIL